MAPLRVVVVDDDQSVRRLLSVALPLAGTEVEIVGEASDGLEAVSVAALTDPDVIILDHMMPRRSGAEAVPDLRRVSPFSEILMFSAYIDSPEAGGEIERVTSMYGLKAVPKGGLTELEAALSRIAEKRSEP